MSVTLKHGTVLDWRSALDIPSIVSDRHVILIAAAVEDCGSSPTSAIRWLKGKPENADKVWVGLLDTQKDLFEQIVSLKVGPHTWPTKPLLQQPSSGGEPSTPASGIHSGFATAASCSAAPAAAVSDQAHIPATLPVSAAAVGQLCEAAAPSPEEAERAGAQQQGGVGTSYFDDRDELVGACGSVPQESEVPAPTVKAKRPKKKKSGEPEPAHAAVVPGETDYEPLLEHLQRPNKQKTADIRILILAWILLSEQSSSAGGNVPRHSLDLVPQDVRLKSRMSYLAKQFWYNAATPAHIVMRAMTILTNIMKHAWDNFTPKKPSFVTDEANALSRAAFAVANAAAAAALVQVPPGPGQASAGAEAAHEVDAASTHVAGVAGQAGKDSATAGDANNALFLEQLNQLGAEDCAAEGEGQGGADGVGAEEFTAGNSNTDISASAATRSDSTAMRTGPTTSNTAATVAPGPDSRERRPLAPSQKVKDITAEAEEDAAAAEKLFQETLAKGAAARKRTQERLDLEASREAAHRPGGPCGDIGNKNWRPDEVKAGGDGKDEDSEPGKGGDKRAATVEPGALGADLKKARKAVTKILAKGTAIKLFTATLTHAPTSTRAAPLSKQGGASAATAAAGRASRSGMHIAQNAAIAAADGIQFKAPGKATASLAGLSKQPAKGQK